MTSSSPQPLNLSHPLYCVAHRGGAHQHTENTLAALSNCLALGVDAIEVDIWLVGGELLVTHDRRLGNTLPGQGRLIDQHPTHLRSLELACGNRLATLQEVLDLLEDRVTLNIELKGPGCAPRVADVLESHVRDKHYSFEQYLVSSFDHQQLFTFKQRLPQVRRGVLVAGIPLDYAACCEVFEAYSFNPNISFINQPLVDDAKRRGLKVWVYTVNEVDDMCHLSAMGVDGIFTDCPARLLELNAQCRSSR